MNELTAATFTMMLRMLKLSVFSSVRIGVAVKADGVIVHSAMMDQPNFMFELQSSSGFIVNPRGFEMKVLIDDVPFLCTLPFSAITMMLAKSGTTEVFHCLNFSVMEQPNTAPNAINATEALKAAAEKYNIELPNKKVLSFPTSRWKSGSVTPDEVQPA